MRTLCDGCHTFYEIPPGLEGRMGCPYCEHINNPQADIDKKGEPSNTPLPDSHHNKTLVGFPEGSLKDELTSVNRLIQNKKPELPKTENLFLVLLTNSTPQKEFRITKAKTTIGRKGCDISLKDPEVSRRHCILECYNGNIILKDLGSANGTLLNGQFIKADFLKDQDELQAGNSVFKFCRKPKKV